MANKQIPVSPVSKDQDPRCFFEGNINRLALHVPEFPGGEVATSLQFHTCHQWREAFMKRIPKTRFIHCSSIGAHIKGMRALANARQPEDRA